MREGQRVREEQRVREGQRVSAASAPSRLLPLLPGTAVQLPGLLGFPSRSVSVAPDSDSVLSNSSVFRFVPPDTGVQ